MSLLNLGYDSMVKVLTKQGEQFAKYRSRVPECSRGPWRVEKFTVEIDLQNLRLVRDGRGCSPGTFTRLMHKNRGGVMSDTDAEIRDFRDFVDDAAGRVLVFGLGLGCVTQSLLDNDEVSSVTVVEIDADVIAMISPHVIHDKLTIIEADALHWKPKRGQRFDYGWYDIWDNICGDNWPEMRSMKARLRRQVKRQFCWCEERTEMNAD